MSDEVRAVDINSLDLEEDEVQFDPSVDSTAQQPPVPDGIYRVKPRFGGDGPNWQSKQSDGKVTALWPKQNVQFVITEGPFEGQVVFGMASTMVLRNGGSTIGTILATGMGLGDEVSQCRKHSELAKLFERAVEQGRELQVETEWRAEQKQADGKYKRVKTGMRNFPLNGDGKYKHVIDVGGDEVTAQAAIKHFLPL